MPKHAPAMMTRPFLVLVQHYPQIDEEHSIERPAKHSSWPPSPSFHVPLLSCCYCLDFKPVTLQLHQFPGAGRQHLRSQHITKHIMRTPEELPAAECGLCEQLMHPTGAEMQCFTYFALFCPHGRPVKGWACMLKACMQVNVHQS